MPYGYGGLNPYVLIIVILIVLQWFRVGSSNTNVAGVGFSGGTPMSPEPGLLNNGGLFIIALFLLVFCGCFRNYPNYPVSPTAVSPARYC
jgi:hypothetical protein